MTLRLYSVVASPTFNVPVHETLARDVRPLVTPRVPLIVLFDRAVAPVIVAPASVLEEVTVRVPLTCVFVRVLFPVTPNVPEHEAFTRDVRPVTPNVPEHVAFTREARDLHSPSDRARKHDAEGVECRGPAARQDIG